MLPEIFHWDDSQSRVPFTSQPDFPRSSFFVHGTQLSGAYHSHLCPGLMGVGGRGGGGYVGENPTNICGKGKCPLKKKSCKENPKKRFMHKMGRIFILNKNYNSACKILKQSSIILN